MRFGRRQKRLEPGEYPPSFTRSWMRQTLPTTSPGEARAVVERMRRKGWTDEEVAELLLPYMPPSPRGGESEASAEDAVFVPARVSSAWLDQHLPAMGREQIRLVVEELERRGWSSMDVALAVLPHLLPKLPPEDSDAILEGLRELGMTDDEIARLVRPH